jgi:hypothetical protein
MTTVLAWVVALLGGGFLGTWATTLYDARRDRAKEARLHRRELYVDLLAMLNERKRVTHDVALDPLGKLPADLSNERVDRTDALLLLDATPDVRAAAAECVHLIARFWASVTMKVPIRGVDEYGIYQYDFAAVRDADGEARELALRLSLGRNHDDLIAAIKKLTEAMKQDLK